MLIRIREGLKNNKGQALVELALILPILIVLLFGTIEFGRIFNAYLTITSASREGARVAVVGADNLTINQKVIEATPTLDQNSLSVQITPLSGRKRGDSVTVAVEYYIQLYAPLLDIVIDNPMLIRHQTTMRME